jgi:hypothetical protein
MIKSGATTTWTDEYYPSAKAVNEQIDRQISMAAGTVAGDKIEHHVGSIIITGLDPATNNNSPINPNGKLSGTWELVDKMYKTTYISVPNVWNTSYTSYTDANGYISCIDHAIYLQLWLTTKTSINVTSGNRLTIGKLNLVKSGADKFSYDNEDGIAYAIGSDGKSYLIHYFLLNNGDFCDIAVDKVYSNEAIPSNAIIYINAVIPMSNFDMVNSFCDKFYWKRTK